jgi:signal transduction histidine kinase
MTAWAWAHLLAAAMGLVLAALAVSRGGSSPLARPLTLLAFDQFAINAASAGDVITGQPGWPWLGAIAAPLFVPFAFDFVLSFLGRRRPWRVALWATYAFFGAQAALAALDLASTAVEVPGGLHTFAMLLLAPSLPLVAVGLWLLAAHRRETASAEERARAQMLQLALVMVTLFFVTDPLADLGLPVPRLATVGSYIFTALLTQLTLGQGLLVDGEEQRRHALVQALLLGTVTAVVALSLVASFGVQRGVLVIAVTTLSLSLAALGWLFVRSSQRARAGLERFAVLGRFSAQMTHDLRNPLQGAVMAATALNDELATIGTEDQKMLAGSVVTALERLDALINRYEGISRLQVQRSSVALNELVERVLARQRAGEVTLGRELATPGPVLEADRDLLESALENLVKNALEATKPGGRVTARTHVDGDLVELAVQDTGSGLDARAMDQAFELFFTTKAKGSGLGLAFVRQVARAHGGDARLVSREGVGTTVTLTLPLRASPEHRP